MDTLVIRDNGYQLNLTKKLSENQKHALEISKLKSEFEKVLTEKDDVIKELLRDHDNTLQKLESLKRKKSCCKLFKCKN